MSRSGKVLVNGVSAGRIERLENGGYRFGYFLEYLARSGARPVSLTLPVSAVPYESGTLFPFFSGLLAEGNLKELQCRLYRMDPADDFTRLLKTASCDVIGAVTVEEEL